MAESRESEDLLNWTPVDTYDQQLQKLQMRVRQQREKIKEHDHKLSNRKAKDYDVSKPYSKSFSMNC